MDKPYMDLIQAAEQGDAKAQFNLGNRYRKGEGVEQDYEQAAYWYRKAAEQGHVKAQHNLAVCYAKGDGVTQDYKQAAYWRKKATVSEDFNEDWGYSASELEDMYRDAFNNDPGATWNIY